MTKDMEKIERRVFDLIASSVLDVGMIQELAAPCHKKVSLPISGKILPDQTLKFTFKVPVLHEFKDGAHLLIIDSTCSGILYKSGNEIAATDPGHRAIVIHEGQCTYELQLTPRGFFGLHPWRFRINGIYLVDVNIKLLSYSFAILNMFDLLKHTTNSETKEEILRFINDSVKNVVVAPSIKQIIGTSYLVTSGILPVIADEGSSSPSPENNVTNIYYFLRDLYSFPVLTDMKGYTSRPVDPQLSNSLLDSVEHNFNSLSSFEKKKIKDTRMFVLGHSHIDTAWLWPFSETKRKVQRTFLNVVTYLETGYNFIYAQSSALFLKWIESLDPVLLKRIQKLAREGKWIPVGGMWVESDTNLVRGESLARQFLYGQRFFKRIFGRVAKIGWLPDSFGYSGQLPQLMCKSGISYFVLSKLMMNDTNEFPFHIFKWVGIDGSHIPTSILNTDYNGTFKYSEILESWEKFRGPDKSLILYTFGYGDGGGGPTIGMLNSLSESKKIPWIPEIINNFTENELLSNVAVMEEKLPAFSGDLYLEGHRGVYTTNSSIKRFVSELEEALFKLEMVSSLLYVNFKYEYPANSIWRYWEILLRNQFHDVLPGSSIREVYAESERELGRAIVSILTTLGKMNNDTASQTMILNPTPWEYSGLISAADPVRRSREIVDGKKIMNVSDLLNMVYVNIPPLSMTSLADCTVNNRPLRKSAEKPGMIVNQDSKTIKVKNRFITLIINKENGTFNLYDSRMKKYIAKNANKVRAYFDEPAELDAWEIDRESLMSQNKIEALSVSVKLSFNNHNVVAVGVSRKFEDESTVDQLVIVKNDSRIVEVRNKVTSNARLKIFKFYLNPGVSYDSIDTDIPFGVISRKVISDNSLNPAFEFPALHWVDVSDKDDGVALVSTHLHGYNCIDDGLGITLARFPIFPNPWSDEDGASSIFYIVPHEGNYENEEFQRTINHIIHPPIVLKVRGKNNKRLVSKVRKGRITFPFSIEGEGIILESIKKAEDSRDIILRLYNIKNSEAICKITSKDNANIVEMNIIETDTIKNVSDGDSITFKPFEIKTLRIFLP